MDAMEEVLAEAFARVFPLLETDEGEMARRRARRLRKSFSRPPDWKMWGRREAWLRPGKVGELVPRGRVFLCPRCGEAVKVLYLPMQMLTYGEYAGWVRRESLDSVVGGFGCQRCVRPRYFRAWHGSSAWNHVVSYLSGGLLYGREVRRPGWVREMEEVGRVKRKKRVGRREEVVRRLAAGESAEAVAKGMRIGVEAVKTAAYREGKKRGTWKRRRGRAEAVARELGIRRESVVEYLRVWKASHFRSQGGLIGQRAGK